MGAFSRHVLKGMQRVGVETADRDLLATAFMEGKNETLVMVNRGTVALKVAVAGGSKPWAEMERTGIEEANAVSTVPAELVVAPGEIVVLSTVAAEK
jgi:hypothetical protein